MRHKVTIGLNSAEFNDTDWDKNLIDYYIGLGLQSLMHSRFQATKRNRNLTKDEETVAFNTCAEKIQSPKAKIRVTIHNENEYEEYWLGLVEQNNTILPFYVTTDKILIGQSAYEWPDGVTNIIEAVTISAKE